MRMVSGTVLALAAAVSSPALWAGLHGELAMDVALTRFLVAVVVVWMALSTVVAMVGDPPRPTAPEPLPPSPPERGVAEDGPLV